MANKIQTAEPACSFCGKPQSTVNKLIAGPNIMICAECVARCAEIVREGDGGAQSTGGLTQVPKRRDGFSLLFFSKAKPHAPTCSFCGKSGPDLVQPPSTLGTHALICSECLALFRAFIREHLR